MKYSTYISWFLGVAMFTFGSLKFIDPFRSWYQVQVHNSGLNMFSYWAGIAGEMIAGSLLLISSIFKSRIADNTRTILSAVASVMIIAMMATGIYVHLHPAVPAAVLPLKIKPPFIPGLFLLLAIMNIVLIRKQWLLYRL